MVKLMWLSEYRNDIDQKSTFIYINKEGLISVRIWNINHEENGSKMKISKRTTMCAVKR